MFDRAVGDVDVGAPERADGYPPQVQRAGAGLPVQLADRGHVSEPGDTEDAFLFQPPLDPCQQYAGDYLALAPLGGLCGLIPACRLEHEAAPAEDK
jgi:hypothetical protein